MNKELWGEFKRYELANQNRGAQQAQQVQVAAV